MDDITIEEFPTYYYGVSSRLPLEALQAIALDQGDGGQSYLNTITAEDATINEEQENTFKIFIFSCTKTGENQGQNDQTLSTVSDYSAGDRPSNYKANYIFVANDFIDDEGDTGLTSNQNYLQKLKIIFSKFILISLKTSFLQVNFYYLKMKMTI